MPTVTKHANSRIITAANQFTDALTMRPNLGNEEPIVRVAGEFTGEISVQVKRPDQPDEDWQTVKRYAANAPILLETISIRGHWQVRAGVPDGETFSGEALVEIG